MRALGIALAVALGVLGAFNGLFMLVSPSDWYSAVPGVTTTGPFNQHFIRDIGLIYLLIGLCFLAGAAKPRFRVVLSGLATLWLTGHTLFHLWEVAVGISGHSAIARDFAAVTLPAIIGIALTVWAASVPRTVATAGR